MASKDDDDLRYLDETEEETRARLGDPTTGKQRMARKGGVRRGGLAQSWPVKVLFGVTVWVVTIFAITAAEELTGFRPITFGPWFATGWVFGKLWGSIWVAKKTVAMVFKGKPQGSEPLPSDVKARSRQPNRAGENAASDDLRYTDEIEGETNPMLREGRNKPRRISGTDRKGWAFMFGALGFMGATIAGVWAWQANDAEPAHATEMGQMQRRLNELEERLSENSETLETHGMMIEAVYENLRTDGDADSKWRKRIKELEDAADYRDVRLFRIEEQARKDERQERLDRIGR